MSQHKNTIFKLQINRNKIFFVTNKVQNEVKNEALQVFFLICFTFQNIFDKLNLNSI